MIDVTYVLLFLVCLFFFHMYIHFKLWFLLMGLISCLCLMTYLNLHQAQPKVLLSVIALPIFLSRLMFVWRNNSLYNYIFMRETLLMYIFLVNLIGTLAYNDLNILSNFTVLALFLYIIIVNKDLYSSLPTVVSVNKDF